MSLPETKIQEKIQESKIQYEIQEKTIEKIGEDYRSVLPASVTECINALDFNGTQRKVVSTILYYFLTRNLEWEGKMQEVEEVISEVELAFLLMAKLASGQSGECPHCARNNPHHHNDVISSLCQDTLSSYKNWMNDLIKTIATLTQEGPILKSPMEKAVTMVNNKLSASSWERQRENICAAHRAMRAKIMRDHKKIMEEFVRISRGGISWPLDPELLIKLDKEYGFQKSSTVLRRDRLECRSCKKETHSYRAYRDVVQDHKFDCTSKAVQARKEENARITKEIYEMYTEGLNAGLPSLPPVLNLIILEYYYNKSEKLIEIDNANKSLRLAYCPYMRVQIGSEASPKIEVVDNDKEVKIEADKKAQEEHANRMSDINAQLAKLMQQKEEQLQTLKRKYEQEVQAMTQTFDLQMQELSQQQSKEESKRPKLG